MVNRSSIVPSRGFRVRAVSASYIFSLIVGPFAGVLPVFTPLAMAETTADIAPSGVGNYTQWQVFPGAGAAAKVAAVAANNGNTSFIFEGANNNAQSFVFPGTIPTNAIVNSVTLNVVAKKSSLLGILPAPGTVKMKFFAENGPTPSDRFVIGTEKTMTTNYATYSETMTTNPDTGLSWTDDEVNGSAMNFGVFRSNGVEYVRATQIYVTVDYTPDTDGDTVPDATDNCVEDANTDQTDTDNDDAGDACEDEAYIKIAKETVPDGSIVDFTFTGAITDTLSDGESSDIVSVAPGEYTVEEGAYADWRVTGISCDDGDSTGNLATRTATFVAADDEIITCTFTNTLLGKLNVIKYAPGDDEDGSIFNFTSPQSDEVAPFSINTFEANQYGVFVLPGTYTVNEDAAPGWAMTNNGCSSVAVTAGAQTDCTITNTLTCNGLPATILGSGVINGTPGSDVIIGSSGNDTIDGKAGADTICGGGGRDVVTGGLGNDDLFGQEGNDTLLGGLNNDDLDGGPGADYCHGGVGSDTQVNCEENDLLKAIIVVTKDAQPDSTQDFSYTAGLGSFTLDDDADAIGGDGTYSNTTYFSRFLGDRSVTENSVEGWDLDSISCDDTTGDEEITDTETRTATVDLNFGDVVECTFVNTEEVVVPPSSVKVTIVKYLNGVAATAENANSTAFPMHSIWSDTEPNFGSGNGDYTLNPTGVNNANPYYATTSDMPVGADYSTYETASPECTEAYPYELVGYKTGNSLEDAEEDEASMTQPSFTDLTSDKFVIVMNESCEPVPTPTVKVTIVKYLDGSVANAESANSTAFPMHSVWSDTMPAFAAGEGDYTLSATGFNNPNAYYAMTSDMPVGADYSTYETAAEECTEEYPYELDGYTTGNTLEAAAEGEPSETQPSFTDLTSDKFVIVWNKTCETPPEPVACTPNDEDLVAYWKLDEAAEATVADDSTANNNDGAVAGTPSGAAAAPTPTFLNSGSYDFDGIDDAVQMPSNVGNFSLTDSFSISAWINPALDSQNNAIYGNTWSNAGYLLRVTADNKIRFILVENGSVYNGMDSAVLSPGWHHVVGSWDGTNVRVYVDGTESSVDPIVNGTVTTISTSAPTFIGSTGEAGVEQYFDGQIDDVRVYSRALSADEVDDLSDGECLVGEEEEEAFLDWGDAPDVDEEPLLETVDLNPTYPTLAIHNGARHTIVEGFMLGESIDGEVNGQPSVQADGDDNLAPAEDDEDGVTFLAPLVTGTSVDVSVEVNLPPCLIVIIGPDCDGYLEGWIDWNKDGDWSDSGEHVFDEVELEEGTHTLSVSVPADAELGETYARFRWSSVGGIEDAGLSYTGSAPDGEVEDYKVTVTAPEGPVACVITDESLVAYWKLDENNEGTTPDSATFNNVGSVSSAGSTSSVGANNFSNPGSFTFNGSTSTVIASDTTGLPSGSDARTISLWMNQTTIGDQATLVSMGNSSSGNQKFIFQVGTAASSTYLFTDGINGANNVTISGDEIPSVGNWHHVALTFDGTNAWSYYLDGSLAKSGVFPDAINTVTNAIEIGSRHDAVNGFFEGMLDDVRIYNVALNGTQIANLAAEECNAGADEGGGGTDGGTGGTDGGDGGSDGGTGGPSITTTDGDTPVGGEDGGGGAHRGNRSGALGAIANFLAGGTTPPGGFGGVAPGGFGGRTNLSTKDVSIICKLKKTIPVITDQDVLDALLEQLSTMLSVVLRKSEVSILEALKDPELCPKPEARATNLTAEAKPFPVDENGIPVTSNDTYYKCLTNTFTRQDVLNNPDTEGREKSPKSCSEYHTGAVWLHPTLNVYFNWKWNAKTGKGTVTPPDGYKLVTRSSNSVSLAK